MNRRGRKLRARIGAEVRWRNAERAKLAELAARLKKERRRKRKAKSALADLRCKYVVVKGELRIAKIELDALQA